MPNWCVSPAPDARGIIWENAAIPLVQFLRRQRCSRVVGIFGLLFWSVPVVGIQGVANITFLQTWSPLFENFHEEHAYLYDLLVTYLPVWALMLLLMLLPKLFWWVAVSYEGHKVRSVAMVSVLSRTFAYQVATVFLSILSGSILMSISWFVQLHGAQCMLTVLATEFPRRSAYFITFVTARVGFSLPMLVLYPLLYRFLPFCGTAGQESPKLYCDFAAEAGDIALIFVIGLVYMVTAPHMMFVCMFYFGMATFVYMWLFAFVYQVEFEGKGHLWYTLFHGIMVGSFSGLLTVSSLINAYDPLGPEYFALWALFVGQIMFYVHCYRKFLAHTPYLAFEDAVALDAEWAEDPSVGLSLDPEYYTAPLDQRRDHDFGAEKDGEDPVEDLCGPPCPPPLVEDTGEGYSAMMKDQGP